MTVVIGVQGCRINSDIRKCSSMSSRRFHCRLRSRKPQAAPKLLATMTGSQHPSYPSGRNLDVHQSFHQLGSYTEASAIWRNGQSRDVSVRRTVGESATEANDSASIEGYDRPGSSTHHLSKSTVVLHARMPTYVDQQLAHVLEVLWTD